MTARPEDSDPKPQDLLAPIRELLMERMRDMSERQPWCCVLDAHLVNAFDRILGEEEQIDAAALRLTMVNGTTLRLTLTPVPSASSN